MLIYPIQVSQPSQVSFNNSLDYSICIQWYALFQQTSKQRIISCADKRFCILLPSKRPANNEQTDCKHNFLAFAKFGTVCLLVCSFAGFGRNPYTYAHTCATMPCEAFCCCGSGSLPTERDGGQKSANGTIALNISAHHAKMLAVLFVV